MIKEPELKKIKKIVLTLQINFGQKSTDKSFITHSFCEYFSTVARNLKSKLILPRDFVWRNPAAENLPNRVTKSQFTYKAVKELEILKELEN